MNETLLKQEVTRVFVEKGWLEEVQRETERSNSMRIAKSSLCCGYRVIGTCHEHYAQ